MDFNKMKKDALIDEARERKIDATGSVDELRERLKLHESNTSIINPKAEDIPYRLMDMEDDKAFLDSIKGILMKKYVYSVDGKEGLSAVGIDNCCLALADKKLEVLRIMKTEVKEEGEYFYAMVEVGKYKIYKDKDGMMHEQLLNTCLGSKRQWKKYKGRNGSIQPDTFAYEKCITKAERNGKDGLIDMPFKLRMIEAYKEQGNIKVLDTPKYIEEKIRKSLITEAGGHENLKKVMLKTCGYDSSTHILETDLEMIRQAIEKEKNPEIPEMPIPVDRMYDELEKISGTKYPKTRRETTWGKYVVKFEKHAQSRIIEKLKLQTDLKQKERESK